MTYMAAQSQSWTLAFNAALRPVAAVTLLVIALLTSILACWNALAGVVSGVSGAENAGSLANMDIGHIQHVLGPIREVAADSPGLSVLLFSLVFLLKTTTCLPGASVLVLLAGALWPWWLAAGLALLLVLVGSLMSFFLSQAVVGDGGQWLSIFFGDKIVEAVRSRINTARQERRLKWAVLAVRLFPATPGCVVNMLSPQLQVPIGIFVWTLVVGNLPWILITAFAGSSLPQLRTMQDVLSPQVLVLLTLLAVLAASPMLGRKWSPGPPTAEYMAVRNDSQTVPSCV
eukprot:INCI14555.3.p1 GENE.INCI14555.3~~INCI14555.3.p1  ORF type:complete len:287 (-),score=42.72 INCI14555.3:84-944(-)